MVGEHQIKASGDESKLRFHEVDLKLTQLLWDFGATNAKIEKARLQFSLAHVKYENTRQTLLLEAITAMLSVGKEARLLELAKKSESNIKQQTGLEEARVLAGAGYTTDVLQSKAQLAGATAGRITAKKGFTSGAQQIPVPVSGSAP